MLRISIFFSRRHNISMSIFFIEQHYRPRGFAKIHKANPGKARLPPIILEMQESLPKTRVVYHVRLLNVSHFIQNIQRCAKDKIQQKKHRCNYVREIFVVKYFVSAPSGQKSGRPIVSPQH